MKKIMEIPNVKKRLKKTIKIKVTIVFATILSVQKITS